MIERAPGRIAEALERNDGQIGRRFDDPDRVSSAERRPRLLFADDSPANRLLMKMILGEVGEVTTVDNGREALAALSSLEFDLFISDVRMPVMDGCAATQALRASELIRGGPRLPVIFATADATFSLARARAIGADDVLIKPFTAESVLEAVTRWCEHLGYKVAV
jgi:CheY-like chemotaxis protein